MNTDLEELRRVQDEEWLERKHWGLIIKKIRRNAINKKNDRIIEILYKQTKFAPTKEDHIDILILIIQADMDDMIKRVRAVNRKLATLIRKKKGYTSVLTRAVKEGKHAITRTLLEAGAMPNMLHM